MSHTYQLLSVIKMERELQLKRWQHTRAALESRRQDWSPGPGPVGRFRASLSRSGFGRQRRATSPASLVCC